jgi:phytoene desaturase
VQGLVRLIEGQGGRLRCNAHVSASPCATAAPPACCWRAARRWPRIVVSNADSATTYRKLLAPEHRKRWTDAKLDRARYSMSLFVWYFGLDRKYPDVDHHMILLGPRYRGLLTDIFQRKRLADDFSLYLHRPSATDPAMAPPGCDGFYVLSPVPHLQSGTDWATRPSPTAKPSRASSTRR